ncbi:MAG: hypothetical protein ACFWUC_11240 [Oscillospiraceae bacterium]
MQYAAIVVVTAVRYGFTMYNILKCRLINTEQPAVLLAVF